MATKKPPKDKEQEAKSEPAAKPAAPAASQGTSRLHARYAKEISPALQKEFSYKNPMAIPRLRKVVVNIGVGEATQNIKLLDGATQDLSLITGQKPILHRARKSIAQFKVRKGQPIG